MSDRVSNKVRDLRREHDRMTQQGLADTVGVSRQTIISIESGRYTPSLLLAMKIAKTFGLRVEEVFSIEPGS